MNVLLAGEGARELGEWAHLLEYRPEHPRPGVIEQLARRVSPSGWRVRNAIVWRRIRKYRAGDFRKAETRNVLGLALMATEGGEDVVVFSRDLDSDTAREEQIDLGIAESARLFPRIRMAGGCAIPVIEGWLLALAGERETERRRDAKARFDGLFPGPPSVDELIATANIDAVPDDAASLKQWLGRVRSVLASVRS